MKRALLALFCGFLLQTFAGSAAAACVSQSIAIGQTVNGSLSTTDCVDTEVDGDQFYGDYYRFSGTAGQQIAITQTSSAFDGFLFLIYPDGSYVSNNDGGGGLNARIPATSGYLILPQTGTYTVEVSSNRVLQTGAYTLAIALNATVPPPGTEDPVLKKDVTGIVDNILGLIGGDSATGITQQLQLILQQVINAGSNSTCPVITTVPSLTNLDQLPPNLQMTINYGTGCTTSDRKTMSGSASISFTNLKSVNNTISASSFSVTFNSIKVNGAMFANGSVSGDFSLHVADDSSDTLNIDSGHASVKLTNFLLSNGDVINGTVGFTATSAASMQLAITMTTPDGNIALNLTFSKQADGSYIVNTSAPGQGSGYAIEIKGLVLNQTSCTSNYPIGGQIVFKKGGQTATVTFDASCSGKYAYAATGVATLNYQGLWWNQNESGWGMSVTQHQAMIFAAVYTYDQSGKPLWYVMSSCPLSGTSCTGDIYKVSGGTPPGVPWNGSGKIVTPVGVGTLTFTDTGKGTFSFIIDGVNGTKAITQQVFATGTSAPPIDFTDLWWNANESGWGVSLTQQYGIIFATWYVYDSAGKAIWYVASNCTVAGSSCSGDLYQVNGGTPITSPWNGSGKVVTKVGAVSFLFNDANNGTMVYTINNAVGTRAITRQGF